MKFESQIEWDVELMRFQVEFNDLESENDNQ